MFTHDKLKAYCRHVTAAWSRLTAQKAGQRNFVRRPPNLLYAFSVEQPSIAEENNRRSILSRARPATTERDFTLSCIYEMGY